MKPQKNIGLIYYLSSFPYSTEQDNENQNTLVTNGRPRPFYRRTSLTLRQETTEIIHQNPKSLLVNNISPEHYIQLYINIIHKVKCQT